MPGGRNRRTSSPLLLFPALKLFMLVQFSFNQMCRRSMVCQISKAWPSKLLLRGGSQKIPLEDLGFLLIEAKVFPPFARTKREGREKASLPPRCLI